MRLVPAASVALGTTLAVGGIDADVSAAIAVCALCAATAGAVIAFGWTSNGTEARALTTSQAILATLAPAMASRCAR